MRTYTGVRLVGAHKDAGAPRDAADEGLVTVRDFDGAAGRLKATELAARKSPAGFNWGYGGSGPAALAHSILADVAGLAYADAHYQEFKQTVIAALPQDRGWTITSGEVSAWMLGRRSAR